MFSWFTMEALSSTIVSWFGVISVPAGILIGIGLTLWIVEWVVSLTRRKAGGEDRPG